MFGKFKRPIRALAIVLALLQPATVQAEVDAGSYLAGRQAFAESDFSEAARYFARAMTSDPTNTAIMEDGLVAYIAEGAFDRALAVARRLETLDPDNDLTHLVILTDRAINDDWTAVRDMTAEADPAQDLVNALASAWAEMGLGNMSEAIRKFDGFSDASGLGDFGRYNKSLALALAGDLESAEGLLADDGNAGLIPERRRALAKAGMLAQLGETERAIAILDLYLSRDIAPDVLAMREAFASGASEIPAIVQRPQDGLAEVLYSVARALAGETSDSFPLVYARLAGELRPDNADTMLLIASILEELGQYALAVEAYDGITRDNPSYVPAELGRADALRRSGAAERAIEVLNQLAEDYPDIPGIHTNLGDVLRMEQRYDDASKAYDRALELYDPNDQSLWFVYYTRGITHEREDRWELAEADFRKALELNPDQPAVLNYLGYSFVELQTNLQEALDMIERAVELRPRDGYITDSLGWALYRLGRYDEAVTWMEKAVELTPLDPVINDHLGDVLWAVGRTREARFQWNRALSLEPEEADAKRIRRKLEVGLDVVLAEEGAEPLAVANGD